jgi:hypothetical protein
MRPGVVHRGRAVAVRGQELGQRSQHLLGSLLGAPETEPGLVVASAEPALLDCSFAQPIMASWGAAITVAAVPRKRRRLKVISLNIYLSPSNYSSVHCCVCLLT